MNHHHPNILHQLSQLCHCGASQPSRRCHRGPATPCWRSFRPTHHRSQWHLPAAGPFRRPCIDSGQWPAWHRRWRKRCEVKESRYFFVFKEIQKDVVICLNDNKRLIQVRYSNSYENWWLYLWFGVPTTSKTRQNRQPPLLCLLNLWNWSWNRDRLRFSAEERKPFREMPSSQQHQKVKSFIMVCGLVLWWDKWYSWHRKTELELWVPTINYAFVDPSIQALICLFPLSLL